MTPKKSTANAPDPAALYTARTPRRSKSRDRILESATVLFTQRGYERTTVDEIGMAAGLTGPSIYRHFASKAQLLDEVIALGLQDTLAATADLLSPDVDPMRAMRGMVAVWVNSSMDSAMMTQTFIREYPKLDFETRQGLRRHYRTVTEAWTTVLGRLRPGLSEAERQAMVDSAFWLIWSQAFYRTTLSREDHARRMRCMVLGALLADDDPDGGEPD